jgi:hypothetical protein
MSVYIYPFYKISDDIYRPWVPVRIINLSGDGGFIDTMALLDTGADHCVFPKFVAGNIDLKGTALSSELMQGLQDQKIEVWKHNFRIELKSPDRKQIIWKSKDMIVGCVDHDNIPAILGFSNFMCHFKITFNHATKKIIIDDHPKV